jgi:hypothetical protein
MEGHILQVIFVIEALTIFSRDFSQRIFNYKQALSSPPFSIQPRTVVGVRKLVNTFLLARYYLGILPLTRPFFLRYGIWVALSSL